MGFELSSRRIAILGAGGAGVCTALELAQRGHEVDLFESRDEAVTQASFANEGKIHLGYIYAKDTSLTSASQMINGALEFETNLQRWVSFRAADIVSTPFYYGIHRGSLMNPEEVAHHYSRCSARYDEVAAATGLDYLGMKQGSATRRLSEAEYPEQLNADYLDAIFETTEYAVDPRLIATLLRDALRQNERLTLRTQHRVLGLRESSEKRGGYHLRFEHQGHETEEWYSDLANTMWHERLPVDREMGIRPSGPWSHRYKFGHRIFVPLEASELPSCTYVQGPFGDIVNFRDNGIFLSWYPTGRTGMSTAETAPQWHDQYSVEERFGVFESSLREWKRRCPALGGIPMQRDNVDPFGGVIYALGTTDVDNEKSRLHERYEVGIQSRKRYHSLDTGKFTLIPYWAPRLADRIEACAR